MLTVGRGARIVGGAGDSCRLIGGVIMAYAATFKCTRCGEECEFRAANFADSGLCDECYAARADVGPCERCGELSDSRAFATPDDWNSPLWCKACRVSGGAA